MRLQTRIFKRHFSTVLYQSGRKLTLEYPRMSIFWAFFGLFLGSFFANADTDIEVHGYQTLI